MILFVKKNNPWPIMVHIKPPCFKLFKISKIRKSNGISASEKSANQKIKLFELLKFFGDGISDVEYGFINANFGTPSGDTSNRQRFLIFRPKKFYTAGKNLQKLHHCEILPAEIRFFSPDLS